MRPNVPLKFDVFVQYSGRYLHYRSVSDVFESDRIGQFIRKGVKKIFIREQDEAHYLKYLEVALDDLQDTNVSLADRSAFASDALMSEVENAEKNLDTEEGYKSTQSRIDKVTDFLSTEPGALKNMLLQAGVNVDNSQHSANVAALSLGLAGKLGIKEADELQPLGLAALLHDIGKQKLGLDPDLLREKMTKEQIQVYRKHPQAGVDMLAGKKYITPKVLKLILEHEEQGEGQGFPEKKRLIKLPLSGQILNLCNEFDHFAMFKQLPRTEALSAFFEERGSLFVPEHIDLLGTLMDA